MASRHRQAVEEAVDDLLADSTATDVQLRGVQDQIFALRRSAPLVPEWYYKAITDNYESDMRYAANQLVEDEVVDHGNDN